jgi:hypothetical protein
MGALVGFTDQEQAINVFRDIAAMKLNTHLEVSKPSRDDPDEERYPRRYNVYVSDVWSIDSSETSFFWQVDAYCKLHGLKWEARFADSRTIRVGI